MSDHRIVFGEPWFDEAEERLVLETLRSRWIGQGPLVERFEAALRDYTGADQVATVSSCTAALHLSLLAAGVQPGDEVITTPFTFVATVNAIQHVGAVPVLVDPERDSLSLSPEAVERALGPRTRAVVPVHFGGRPLDVAGFAALADRHGVWIVEDAAHALGAVSGGRPIGGSGHPRILSCFSFYPNKNLASAEGGAVAGASAEAIDRIRRLRLHGLDVDAWQRYRDTAYRPSLAVEAGHKYNWTDLQAAIALPQLEKLEGFLAIREHLAARYDELLADVPGVRPVDRGPAGLRTRHALHLYQVELLAPPPARDRVVGHLRERGVGAAVHYIGVNQHPHYRAAYPGPFPVSDWASDALLTLPLHPRLTEADLRTVVECLGGAVAAEPSATSGARA